VPKLSEKKRLLLTVVVAVLFTGGLVALILNDRSEIAVLEGEITELDARIAAADVEIQKTPEREQKVVVFRAVETRELAILPDQQKIAEFYQGLSKFFVAANLRFRELPESTPVESDLSKGIYVTRSVVEGQGDAAAILKFINLLENDPRLVAVKGLKIGAGDPSRQGGRGAPKAPDEEDAPVVHDLTVHLESYFYNPAGLDFKPVTIRGEEQRLAEPAVKEAIASFQPERPATYVRMHAASRRDSLVDPRERRRVVDEAAEAAEYARQEGVVLEVETALRDLLEVDEQVRALLRNGELFKADRLQQELELKVNELRVRLAQVVQMKTVTNAALMVRVQAVQQRVDEIVGHRALRDTSITRALAEKTLSDLKAHFENQRFAEVATLGTAWTEFSKGKQIDADAKPVHEAILALRTRSRTLAETEGITVAITGTIVHEREPSRSVATINGVSVQPGDAIDPAGEVRVHAIRRDGVEFVYKGEVFLRRRADGRPVLVDPKGGKSGGKAPAAAPNPVGKPGVTASATSGS
jgi:hypothetical protein